MTDVPKIFFIWFGAELPSYAHQTIDQAKNLNPDFEVIVIHKTLDWLTNESNNIRSEIDHVLSDSILLASNRYCSYGEVVKRNQDRGFKYIFTLADVFRLKLINTYGGIYLDLDAYPIRPFEVPTESFVCSRHIEDNYIANDCFYLGSVGQTDPIYDYAHFKKSRLQTKPSWWHDLKYLAARDAFFKCKPFDTSFAEGQDVIHFAKNSWKPQECGQNAPMLSPYDDKHQGDIW